MQTLTALDGEANDRLGYSVVLYHSVLVVGARYNGNDNGIKAGRKFLDLILPMKLFVLITRAPW